MIKELFVFTNLLKEDKSVQIFLFLYPFMIFLDLCILPVNIIGLIIKKIIGD